MMTREQAIQQVRQMELPELIAYWNDRSADHYCRMNEIARKDDQEWFNRFCNEVKVEITSKYVKFFRRDDVFSCYTYPALSELKKDIVFRREIIATLEESNQFDSDEWATWVDGTCDMPPFPISVIFNSEYQNYKFQMYE